MLVVVIMSTAHSEIVLAKFRISEPAVSYEVRYDGDFILDKDLNLKEIVKNKDFIFSKMEYAKNVMTEIGVANVDFESLPLMGIEISSRSFKQGVIPVVFFVFDLGLPDDEFGKSRILRIPVPFSVSGKIVVWNGDNILFSKKVT